jgi:hypothetical protein
LRGLFVLIGKFADNTEQQPPSDYTGVQGSAGETGGG